MCEREGQPREERALTYSAPYSALFVKLFLNTTLSSEDRLHEQLLAFMNYSPS